MRIRATPPPLSRRLTAVIAVTSLATSLAVLVISIPRLERAEDATEATAAPDPVRGVATTTAGAPRTVPVVTVGGVMLASSEEVGSGASRLIAMTDDDTFFDATVVHVDEVLGLALLETVEVASLAGAAPVPGPALRLGVGDEISVSDGAGRPTIRARIGVATIAVDGLLPVDIEVVLRGARLAFDADGALLGVVVRHHHATWLVTGERLNRLLGAAVVATGQ